MKKKLNREALTQRILALKAGQQFEVETSTERGVAVQVAKTLRQAGRIDFTLASKTRENGGGFVLFALS